MRIKRATFIYTSSKLREDQRVIELAKTLNVSRPQGLGHVIFLWGYVVQFNKGSGLVKWEPLILAYGADWEGDPDIFAKALVTPGFLELRQEGLFVIDWDDITGATFKGARRVWNQLRRVMAPQIYARDGGACVRCGATENLSVDHIHPIARGGGNEETNLQTLCRRCNSSKGARVNALV